MAVSDADTEFREFVSVRQDQLRRLAFLMCGDIHRAEDAVQLALARLYSVWHRTKVNSADAYIRRIVINVVRSEQRRAWFRRERSTELLPERQLSDSTTATVDRLTIRAALARLPKRQRAAIILRYWEDRSVEQTAEILQCSQGTVKSQCARGLRTLRGLLAENEVELTEGVLA